MKLILKNNNGINICMNEYTGRFSIEYNREKWIGSEGKAVINNMEGQLVSKIKKSSSEDKLGKYDELTMELEVSNGQKKTITARIRLYEENHIMFEHEFCDDYHSKESGDDLNGIPNVAFPHFNIKDAKSDLHLLTLDNERTFFRPLFAFGNITRTGQYGRNVPLVLMDNNYYTMVISPGNHYVVGTVAVDDKNQTAACGIAPCVTAIPKGTVFKTLISYGKGVNATIDNWGNALVSLSDVCKIDKYGDASLKYLNYWTDAGAAYWYNTEQGKTYGETLLHLFSHHRKTGLPVGAYQLDSWWYHRDGEYHGFIKRWLPKESVKCKNYNAPNKNDLTTTEAVLFPEQGIEGLQKNAGKPFIAHFKHISPQSEYINGNENSDPPVRQFDFDIDKHAVPAGYEQTKEFFKYVINQPEWGLVCLEHDWLNHILFGNRSMKTLKGAHEFFKGMNDAALESKADNNVVPHKTIQFCMATPHILMESVTLQAVTTLRTSADSNHKGCEGAERWWWNTFAGRFATALGKYPFFDNRHSNNTGTGHLKSNSELEFILICMSCGILALGDFAGNENKELIFRCITDSGVVVKPDNPAVPLDRCFLASPYSENAKEALVNFAYNQYHFGRIFYIQAINCNKEGRTVGYRFAIDEIEQRPAEEYVIYNYRTESTTVVKKNEIISGTLSDGDYAYMVISPLISGMAVIGDVRKFVTASKALFDEIRYEGKKIYIKAHVDNSNLIAKCYMEDEGVVQVKDITCISHP